MANHYVTFSALVPYQTPEQRDWVLARFRELKDRDGGAPCSYEDHPDDQEISVYTDESGDVGRLAELVADFQREFHLTEPWTMSWANTCSKLLDDSFGGSALAVYRGKIFCADPELEAQRWIAREQISRADADNQATREYHVAWEIDLHATSPEHAARKALAIQRDPNSSATVFDVTEMDGDDTKRIDLTELADEDRGPAPSLL